MKKILLIAIAAIFFISCKKESTGIATSNKVYFRVLEVNNGNVTGYTQIISVTIKN